MRAYSPVAYMEMKGKLSVGFKYDRLLLIERIRIGSRNYWRCRCDCGTVKAIDESAIAANRTHSCGCFNRESTPEKNERNKTHGWKHTKTYRVWSRMKERCMRTKHKSYSDYGGRGISVCDSWQSFEPFLEDMGPVPEGMSIERKDVNGDYCASNCIWATQKEQANNKRNNRVLFAFGEHKTASQWLDDARCAANRTTLYKHDRRYHPPLAAVKQHVLPA